MIWTMKQMNACRLEVGNCGGGFDKKSLVKKLDNKNFVKYFDKKSLVKNLRANEMKPIQNLVGQVADKENFFERPRETKKLWDALATGEHILFAAPRRSGKTSLLYHLLDNPRENTMFLFLEVEAVSSIEEFFKQLRNVLLNDTGFSLAGFRISEGTKNFLGRLRGIGSDALAKIEFEAGEKTPPNKALEGLLGKIAEKIPDGERLVIMIDEFAQAVQNIAEDNPTSAKEFLLAQRALRQNGAFRNKIQFLYCGSIGLEYVAERLDASNAINDVRMVNLQPLRREEASELIRSIITHPNYSVEELLFTKEIVTTILDRIRWFVPYYLQIFLDVVQTYVSDNELTELTEASIDESYKQMLGVRKNFVWWEERLRKAFKGSEYKFVMDVLNTAALKQSIDEATIADFAGKHNIERWKSITEALKHDGYIVETGEKSGFGKLYRFVSPVLQDWWRAYVA